MTIRTKTGRALLQCLVSGVLTLGTAMPLLWQGSPAVAQNATQNAAQTAIADTVQYADGSAAQGSILLSWPAFTTASGVAVQKGSLTLALGAGGALQATLAANAGATPVGTFYTAVYHLADGTVSREFWSVPVSAQPVKLSAVRTGSLPLSVAVQTVSKQYVDQAIARAGIAGAVVTTVPAVDTTNASNITSGTLPVAQSFAITGDVTKPAGTGTATVGRVNGAALPVSAGLTGTNASGQLITATGANVAAALGYIPAQSAQISGNLAQNVLADYNVFPGTGTTLPDTSGNGNHGTLTGAAAWIQGGISLPQNAGVSLPAGLNTAKTFAFAYFATPITTVPGGGPAIANYVTLLSNSNGSPGINFLLNAPGGPGLGAISLWNSNIGTTASSLVTGVHVAVFVCGTGTAATDHIYLDGAEVGYANGPNFGGCSQGSGNLYLGSSTAGPWGGSGLYGNIYRARFYSVPLAPADAQALSNVFLADLANRGIPTSPTAVPHTAFQIHLTADSIGAGVGGNGTVWLNSLALTNYPSYTPVNWSLAGAKLYDFAASDQVRVVPYCKSPVGQTFHILSAGTNDASAYGDANSFATATFGYLQQDVQQDLNAGCKPYVATMISRSGSPAGNGTWDAYKNAYNSLIRARWKQIGAAGLIDFNAIPELGADGASASSAYFNDGIHPTSTGYLLMAAAASNAMNVVSGSNEASPRIVTAATYTMAASDTYVDAQPAANSTYTLPSCVGQSGAVYMVNNPQNTFSVGLRTSAATQPVNGVDYSSSALTVPGNASIRLRDVANSTAAGGCHWEM